MSASKLIEVRRLDRAEAFFWFLDRSSSMNFAVLAEGTGALDRAALQHALDGAQLRHPMLRATVQADSEQRLCFVEAQPVSSIPLEMLCTSDWRSSLVVTMVELFALEQAPLMRAQLYCLANGSWALVLIFLHSIADARSAFSLLSELLLDCAAGPQAREQSALITCVQPLGPQTALLELARKLSGGLQEQLASGEAHLFYNFIPRASRTSLLSNAGLLPTLPG